MEDMESKKLNREDLTEAAGGETYYDEYIVWVNLCKKVMDAAYRHGYRKACCPKCGASLESHIKPFMLGKGGADEKCIVTAYETGNLMCEVCRSVSNPDDWAINSLN